MSKKYDEIMIAKKNCKLTNISVNQWLDRKKSDFYIKSSHNSYYFHTLNSVFFQGVGGQVGRSLDYYFFFLFNVENSTPYPNLRYDYVKSKIALQYNFGFK